MDMTKKRALALIHGDSQVNNSKKDSVYNKITSRRMNIHKSERAVDFSLRKWAEGMERDRWKKKWRSLGTTLQPQRKGDNCI